MVSRNANLIYEFYTAWYELAYQLYFSFFKITFLYSKKLSNFASVFCKLGVTTCLLCLLELSLFSMKGTDWSNWDPVESFTTFLFNIWWIVMYEWFCKLGVTEFIFVEIAMFSLRSKLLNLMNQLGPSWEFELLKCTFHYFWK